MGLERDYEVVPLIDLAADAHVHTGFSVGRDSVGAIVTAAERVGIEQLTFGDIVTPRANWLPVYQKSIQRAQQRTDIDLRIAVEVEIARADGWLDFPTDLGGLDVLSVGASRLPLPSGPAEPRRVNDLLRSGALSRADLVELAVAATTRAVERASRYAPAQLARPLNALWQLGVEEAELDDDVFAPLVDACRCTGAAVEVSESWRTPSPRLAGLFAAAGVPLLAASDARDVAQLGHWRYVARVLSGLAITATQPAAAA
ncbi:hydrolase [Pilimelia columellifera]|uniref:Hydrolase n=1 Tax=Pilimelia columellifera subsp. columellifera TaxID=706583 RepID=A0ABN3N7H4_9ACTN